jgi:recombinational DNA repair ATPase RecF
MQFIKDKTGRFPILLLDDLFAKLDLGRSKKLVSLLNKLKTKTGELVQTIVTTTDMINIENSGMFSSSSKIKKHHLTR